MSYALYVGKDCALDGHGWLAGYGDEPSSHWLEVEPARDSPPGSELLVGMTDAAEMPGAQMYIPRPSSAFAKITVNYSRFKGLPGPITNGGLNQNGVAVRSVWSPSRKELLALTPNPQSGLNFSDLAGLVLDTAMNARAGVQLIAEFISTYGESTYGGNCHLICDPKETWAMIQFAGGKGLWLAERLKPDAIRAFRPGCIGIVPVDEPAHPDFLYSDNFVSFAKSQGWYKGGPFNANAVYGDAKGKWEGVRWIENELAQRVTRFGGVAFEDIVWALRTTQLTGETAGYGQIVPLKPMSNQAVRHLWHAPCGPVSAPFSPVFIGQSGVPREFQKHRYLSADESQKFLSRESPVVDGQQMSDVSQAVEATVSAFADSKRLVYLILQDPDRYLPEVTEVFASREARLGHALEKLICSAETLLHAGMEEEAYWLLTYFSHSELRKGQTLVQDLIVGLEARSRQMEVRRQNAEPAGFKQIW